MSSSVSPLRPEEKTLDANRYATKKTIAQGLLDVALLTANASQLKYVLQVGKQHEFYTLMLSLIIVSIVLQVVVAIVSLSFSMMRDCRLHLEEYHYSANMLNYLTTTCSFLITVLNLLISIFDPSVARYAVFEAPDLTQKVDGS
ncbi:ninjurin-2 isoform X5 [Photinus pyralis]|uniref:ninjurin-2 isoform X5 n=1 Tax=Photinus pyralis TaxID=7054 RepID=UPI0012672766|nr:ninjurin-2 isoform X5 [Photinus pyralis]